MGDEGKPRAGSKATLQVQHSAEVVRLQPAAIPSIQPDSLSGPEALKVVRLLAVNTDNIVVLFHATGQARKRSITRRQIELCVQKGTIREGPFVNGHGNWQMNFYRHAAGEEITCVVAIEWATKLLVISTF
jgi:hypothetical protein